EAQQIEHRQHLAAVTGDAEHEGRRARKWREAAGAEDLEHRLARDPEAKLTQAEAEELLLGAGLTGLGPLGGGPERSLEGRGFQDGSEYRDAERARSRHPRAALGERRPARYTLARL